MFVGQKMREYAISLGELRFFSPFWHTIRQKGNAFLPNAKPNWQGV